MGLEWVKLGVRTFWRHPIALAALFFLCMAGMSLISALPIVGTIVALTLLPTFSLIMMVAAAEVWSNRVPTPVLIWHILRQGKERLAALATLGVCYAVGFGLVMFLSSLVDGGEFARVYLGLAPLSQELAQSASFQAAMWTACLLYLPLSFLFWHAPALVHWHNLPAFKAMFFSIVACTRNIGAFFMFGVGWVTLFLLVAAVLTWVTGLLSLVVGHIAMALMIAAAMALAAMLFTSIVFTFRDCFAAPEKPISAENTA